MVYKTSGQTSPSIFLSNFHFILVSFEKHPLCCVIHYHPVSYLVITAIIPTPGKLTHLFSFCSSCLILPSYESLSEDETNHHMVPAVNFCLLCLNCISLLHLCKYQFLMCYKPLERAYLFEHVYVRKQWPCSEVVSVDTSKLNPELQ